MLAVVIYTIKPTPKREQGQTVYCGEVIALGGPTRPVADRTRDRKAYAKTLLFWTHLGRISTRIRKAPHISSEAVSAAGSHRASAMLR